MSMNQGKLEVVKQEMARVNIDILGISKLKWTGMVYLINGHLIQMTIIPTTVGRNPSEEMEWPLWSTRVPNAVVGCNLKNDRMICLFPRQTIQYHSNPSLCPNQ